MIQNNLMARTPLEKKKYIQGGRELIKMPQKFENLLLKGGGNQQLLLNDLFFSLTIMVTPCDLIKLALSFHV